VLKRILIYDLPNRQVVYTLDAKGQKIKDVSGVALSPDGSLLAILTDGVVQVYRVYPKKCPAPHFGSRKNTTNFVGSRRRRSGGKVGNAGGASRGIFQGGFTAVFSTAPFRKLVRRAIAQAGLGGPGFVRESYLRNLGMPCPFALVAKGRAQSRSRPDDVCVSERALKRFPIC